jgi:hypothetical protein
MTAMDANDIARIRGADGLRDVWDAAPTAGEVQIARALAMDRPVDLAEMKPIGSLIPVKTGKDWRGLVSTAAALQTMKFPAVSYVVPGLIPEGLTILAGKPKIGKSWLGLDLGLAIAGGRFCLGDRKPGQGDVLYCALEDNPRRLQLRMDKLLGSSRTETWPARLTWATSWRRLDQGVDDDIAAWLDSVPAGRLVILDTLAGVRPIKAVQGYTEDYQSLAALHRLANDRGIAIVVLHHTRKMEADDPIDTVSGTLGLAGCADTILVLTRTSKGASLYVRGRDIEEAEHAVEFSKETCRWTILGDAGDLHRSEERQRIMAALSDGEMSVADLVVATGMPRNNLEKLLHFMVKDGEAVRIKRGMYGPSEPPGKLGKPVRNGAEIATDANLE